MFGTVVGRKGMAKVPVGSGWIGHPPGGMSGILAKRDPRWLPPAGKNPGNFWAINTRPFAGAHFAVFPEALCEQPIRAACPALVCAVCGLPRERITVRSGFAGRGRSDDGHPRHMPGFVEREKRSAWGEQPLYETRGWTACECKAGFLPGIVFDPFAGAGTTLVVAKRLGRRYLGCDLNPSYVELAKERLSKMSPAPAQLPQAGSNAPAH